MKKYLVTMSVDVVVEIDEDTTAVTRATDNVEDFHDFFVPPITDEEGVVKYLASAAVVTGVEDASRLDGWADLEYGQATMRVRDVTDAEILS